MKSQYEVALAITEGELTMKVKVENMLSPRTGKKVANQLLIYTDDGVYFQSRQSVIAFRPLDSAKKIQLDRNTWDYSRTTSEYRNQFLGEDIIKTREKIKSGEYELVDLN